MRPSSFTDEIAAEICRRLSLGESLKRVCETPDLPHRDTVYRWLDCFPEFYDNYERARRLQADTFVDEIVDIGDTEEDPVRARVKIDARKWVAGKQRPRKYGDSQRTVHTGEDGGPIRIDSTTRAARIASLLLTAQERADAE